MLEVINAKLLIGKGCIISNSKSLIEGNDGAIKIGESTSIEGAVVELREPN